jgi:predicted O-methyltransferase YrrM
LLATLIRVAFGRKAYAYYLKKRDMITDTRSIDILAMSDLLGTTVHEIKGTLQASGIKEIEGHLFAYMTKFGLLDFPPSWQNQGAPALYVIVKITKPKIVVETGVWWGFSTSFILKALDENGHGHLYSIDIEQKSGRAIPKYLKKRWTFICGSSRTHLQPLLEAVGPIDIFIHDSDHSYENMMYKFRTSWGHLRKGGLLIADNVECNSAFTDFCRNKGRSGYLIYKRKFKGWVHAMGAVGK